MADRTFVVGETIMLQVKVSAPGTRTPVNPARGVGLSSLRKGTATPVVVAPSQFTKMSDGNFQLVIDSSPLTAGVWTWIAWASDSPQATSVIEDTFVLKAPSTPVSVPPP